LRGEAARCDLDVTSEDTSALTVLAPLYVDVSIPGLPQGTNKNTVLQGAYWTGGSPAGLSLRAEWGDSFLLDAGGNDEDLLLGGVSLGPEHAASILANWFAAQLRRPVQRIDWIGTDGKPIASQMATRGRRQSPRFGGLVASKETLADQENTARPEARLGRPRDEPLGDLEVEA
jgi:hypothetical protein